MFKRTGSAFFVATAIYVLAFAVPSYGQGGPRRACESSGLCDIFNAAAVANRGADIAAQRAQREAVQAAQHHAEREAQRQARIAADRQAYEVAARRAREEAEAAAIRRADELRQAEQRRIVEQQANERRLAEQRLAAERRIAEQEAKARRSAETDFASKRLLEERQQQARQSLRRAPSPTRPVVAREQLIRGYDQLPPGKLKDELGAEVSKARQLEAANANNRNKLAKQLASEDQMSNPATRTIAGAGDKSEFRDVKFAVSSHGGKAEDWAKRSSAPYTAPDGTTFETHWIENVRTGQKQQFKTMFIEEKKTPKQY